MKREPYPGANDHGPAMRKLMASMLNLIDEAEKKMSPAEFKDACEATYKLAERIRRRVAKKKALA